MPVEQGPNVRKLIVRKMTMLMVPDGSGIGDVVQKFNDIGRYAREATEWVEAAISAVKAAPGNRHGDDDEAIAGEILRRAGL